MEVLKTYTNFIVINKEHNCYLRSTGSIFSLEYLYSDYLFTSERGAKAGLTKAKNNLKERIASSEKYIASIKNGTDEFFTPEALKTFEEDLKKYTDKLAILEGSEIREVSVDIRFNIEETE